MTISLCSEHPLVILQFHRVAGAMLVAFYPAPGITNMGK